MRLQNTVFLVLVMALFWTCPAGAAAAVGRLAQVEGSVDILKKGQLPAVPAKLEDQIETGDVLRTKSAARAQVRFLDDSVLTIAPGSLVAVDDYFYDRAQNRRRAALNVLRGLVHCLVVRLFQVQEPDFLVKTHTAVLGVRGSSFYALIGARYSAFFGEAGSQEVRSISPAFTKKVVITADLVTEVPLNQEPGDPRRYPDLYRTLLKEWLLQGLPGWVITLDPAQAPWRLPTSGLPEVPGQPGFPEGFSVPPTLKPAQPGPKEY